MIVEKAMSEAFRRVCDPNTNLDLNSLVKEEGIQRSKFHTTSTHLTYDSRRLTSEIYRSSVSGT